MTEQDKDTLSNMIYAVCKNRHCNFCPLNGYCTVLEHNFNPDKAIYIESIYKQYVPDGKLALKDIYITIPETEITDILSCD